MAQPLGVVEEPLLPLWQHRPHRHTQLVRGDGVDQLAWRWSRRTTLPEADKTQFFQAMEEVLARFGNVATCRYETLLLVARKAN